MRDRIGLPTTNSKSIPVFKQALNVCQVVQYWLLPVLQVVSFWLLFCEVLTLTCSKWYLLWYYKHTILFPPSSWNVKTHSSAEVGESYLYSFSSAYVLSCQSPCVMLFLHSYTYVHIRYTQRGAWCGLKTQTFWRKGAFLEMTFWITTRCCLSFFLIKLHSACD